MPCSADSRRQAVHLQIASWWSRMYFSRTRMSMRRCRKLVCLHVCAAAFAASTRRCTCAHHLSLVSSAELQELPAAWTPYGKALIACAISLCCGPKGAE